MIVVLDDGKKSFNPEKFEKIVNFIKQSSIGEDFIIELEDQKGLMNNEHMENYIKQVRELDPNGYIKIFLNHTCDYLVDDAWASKLHMLMEEHHNIYIKITVKTDSNYDNVRKILENTNINTKTNFVFEIDREDFDILPYINLIVHYGMPNFMLLDIKHKNQLDYKKIGEKIVSFTEKRKKRLIALAFECGFPLCMFTNEQIGTLFKSPLVGLDFFCKPRGVLYPDLTVSYCKTTDNYTIPLENLQNIQNMYEQLFMLYEDMGGIYQDCEGCWYQSRLCDGGCKALQKNP